MYFAKDYGILGDIVSYSIDLDRHVITVRGKIYPYDSGIFWIVDPDNGWAFNFEGVRINTRDDLTSYKILNIPLTDHPDEKWYLALALTRERKLSDSRFFVPRPNTLHTSCWRIPSQELRDLDDFMVNCE